MGVYIPNMNMPITCDDCIVPLSKCDFLQKRADDCPLIEIAEPTETLIYDIRKFIAFIEPRMIIASTYAEQIERAEAVKDWFLSIVGEPNAD